MNLKSLALLAILAVPLTTLADKPSTQPSHPFASKGDPVFGRALNRRDGMNQQMPKPTQQEIDDTLAFVQKNFRNHYELFSRLPKDGPFRNNVVLPRMVNRYRQLMRIQDQNPEAYQSLLSQARFEDQALGLARDKNEGKPEADAQMRDVVRQMIKQGLDDRRDRIDKLEKALEEQKKKLEEDEQNQDQLVSDQVDRTTTEFNRMFRGVDRDNSGTAPDTGGVNALTK